MIDFEQDKINKNHYYNIERLIGEVYNIRAEINNNLKDKYFKDIVAILKKSGLLRSVNFLLKYLINNQIDALEMDCDLINRKIKQLKRMNDETRPTEKIAILINGLKGITRDNK